MTKPNKLFILLCFLLCLQTSVSYCQEELDFNFTLDKINKLPDDSNKINLIFQTIHKLKDLDQIDSIYYLSKLSLAISEKLVSKNKINKSYRIYLKKLAYAYIQCGEAFENQANWNPGNLYSITFYKKALIINKSLKDETLANHLLFSISRIIKDIDYDLYESILVKTLDYFTKSNDLQMKAKILLRIAQSYPFHLPNKKIAVQLDVYSLYEDINDSLKLAKLSYEIGYAYSNIKYFELSNKYFKNSIDIYKKMKCYDNINQVLTAMLFSKIHIEKDTLYSRLIYSEIENNLINIRNPKIKISALSYLGLIYLQHLSLFKEVHKNLDEQYLLCLSINDNLGMSKTLYEKGKLILKENKINNNSSIKLINVKRKEINNALNCFMLSKKLISRLSINTEPNTSSLYLGGVIDEDKHIKNGEITISVDRSFNLYHSRLEQQLAFCHQHLRNFELAYNHLSISNTIRDSMNMETERILVNKNQIQQTTSSQAKALSAQKKEIETEIKEKRKYLIWSSIVSLISVLLILSLYRGYKTNRKLNKAIKTIQETQEKLIHQEQLSFEEKLSKQKAEQEMNLLRAQMNPHFIFNALNSIHNCILQKDTLTAASSLTKFSRLIRRILESTRQAVVSLENEISNLELYIQLEQMRFSNKFNYKISIDPEIEINQLNIPPLLLQPFVENSIWHGLMPSKNIGEILIDIKKKGDLLHIVITDNGIGRKRAEEIKNKEHNEHTSHGISITKDRLNVFNNQSLNSESFTIIDLYNDVGDPTGTQVEFDLVIQKDAA